MTTTQTRFFDELAKLMTNAAGAAQGVRREVDTLIQAQMERVLGNMELVRRDEFEAVRAMAQKAREENDALHQRIAALESKILGPAADSPSENKAD
ncbi:MAG: accessory factor UbiK family protein [Hyphomicrobiales bacterium]